MSTALNVIAIPAPAAVANGVPGASEAGSAYAPFTAPEGQFKDLLAQRIQAGAAEPGSAGKPESAPEGALDATTQGLQNVDLKELPPELLAAGLASPGPAQASAGLTAALGGDAQAPLQSVEVARQDALQSLWAPKSEGTTPDAAAGAARAAPGSAQALRAERNDAAAAASNAGSGNGLPGSASEAANARAERNDQYSAARVAGANGGHHNSEARTEPTSSAALGGSAAGTTHGAGHATGAAQAAPVSATGATDGRPSMQVATPLGRAEWPGALGDRVSWLVGQKIQVADIQITPPQLGPIEVRITMQNDQASVAFVSAHAVVREAIQAALPRLNDLLAQGGLTLGQTSVGAESFAGQQQRFAQADNGVAMRDGVALNAIDTPAASAATQRQLAQVSRLTGVDTYV